jgi:phosphoglycolate phosphatase
MPYRMLLWDFDGTLADSLSVSVKVLNSLAPGFGFKPITDADAARGMSTRQFLSAHRIGWLKLPRLTRAFHHAVALHMPNVRLVAGLEPVLRHLHAGGIRHGILSSNAPANIQTCLQANGVADLFDFIAGCFKLLGKARGIKQVVKQQRLSRHEVLYVGDELRDIEAAHKAQVDIAAVTWGINDEATLRRGRPKYLVTSPDQLLAMLDAKVPA